MTRHGLIWLLAIILVFLFAPLLISAKDYKSCAMTELQAAHDWYNDAAVQDILDRSNSLYGLLMVSTGVDPAIRKHLAKPMENKDVAPGVAMPKALSPYADHLLEYWANLLQNIWLFCFRLSHALAWMVYLTPFVLAIIFDGVMTRKAKLASFKYTSPTVYNLSWHIIIALAAMSLVAFSLVMPLSIFFYPIVITSVGVLLRLLISNIQHSA